LGYGVNDGQYMNYGSDIYLDMRDAQGNVLSKNAIVQFNAIEGLDFDLSQIITRDGKQLQTVGHHWPLSGPLSQMSRDKMERVGVCMACHRDIPNGSIPIAMLVKAGGIVSMAPLTDDEHSALLNEDIRWAALTKVLLPILILLVIAVYLFLRVRRKRRSKRK